MLQIPPTNLLLLAAIEGAYNKSLSLNDKYWRIFWKRFRREDQQAEKDKIERVTGLARRTREEIAKWNQMTALRFQTAGETPDTTGLPSGVNARRWIWRRQSSCFTKQFRFIFACNATKVNLLIEFSVSPPDLGNRRHCRCKKCFSWYHFDLIP